MEPKKKFKMRYFFISEIFKKLFFFEKVNWYKSQLLQASQEMAIIGTLGHALGI